MRTTERAKAMFRALCLLPGVLVATFFRALGWLACQVFVWILAAPWCWIAQGFREAFAKLDEEGPAPPPRRRGPPRERMAPPPRRRGT